MNKQDKIIEILERIEKLLQPQPCQHIWSWTPVVGWNGSGTYRCDKCGQVQWLYQPIGSTTSPICQHSWEWVTGTGGNYWKCKLCQLISSANILS